MKEFNKHQDDTKMATNDGTTSSGAQTSHTMTDQDDVSSTDGQISDHNNQGRRAQAAAVTHHQPATWSQDDDQVDGMPTANTEDTVRRDEDQDIDSTKKVEIQNDKKAMDHGYGNG